MHPKYHRATRTSGLVRRLLWLLIGLMLVLLAGCGGCGGGGGSGASSRYAGRWGGMSEEEWRAQYEKRQREEEEEARRAQEQARRREEERRRKEQEQILQQRAARRKPKPEASASGNTEANGQNTGPNGQQEDSSPPAAKPKPGADLPASVEQWKDEHYLLARRYAPERLLEAIGQMAPQRQNDPQWIDLLVDLVWQDKQGKTSGGGSAGSTAGSRHAQAILEAVADALAAQRTDRAAQALREILAGQIPTEDYNLAMRSVLSALAKHRWPAHDRLLLQAVLGPENLLTDSVRLQAQVVQQEALRVLSNQADPELQEQLAWYVDQPQLSAAVRQKIEQTFVPGRWDHFRANLVLVQSGRTSPTVRAAILRQLALWSAQAVEVLVCPEGAERPADQLAQGRQIAQTLWKAEFRQALAGPLSPGLAEAAADESLSLAALRLAMTIPTPWARQMAADWLAHRWARGPAELLKIVEQGAYEPGFVVLAGRTLYQQIKPLVPWDTSSHPPNTVSSKPTGAQKQNKPSEKVRAQALAGAVRDWINLVDRAGLRLSEQFLRQGQVGGPTNPSASASGLEDLLGQSGLAGFRPPKESQLLVLFRRDLAEAARQLGWAELQQSSRVWLARWQWEDRPAELLPRLERLLPQGRRRPVAVGAVVESVHQAKSSESLQMVQIRIRPVSPEIPRSLQEKQPLWVDMLCVEIPESAEHSAGEVREKSSPETARRIRPVRPAVFGWIPGISTLSWPFGGNVPKTRVSVLVFSMPWIQGDLIKSSSIPILRQK